MLLTYRYRLYPLRPQLQELDLWTRELAFLWNYSLEQRRSAWAHDRCSVSYLDQQHDLQRWRTFDFEGLGRVPYVVAQMTLQRLDLAFRDFFRRVRIGGGPGYPRRRRTVDSFTFVPRSNLWTAGPNNTWRLKVPFLGTVPVRRHRPPPDAVVKLCTLRREADGWFASLVYALPDPAPPPLGPPVAPVGIDLGLSHLAVLSDGTTVSHPHFLKGAERRLGRAQRRLAREERGSHR
ncbi:MAG: transposase, partial [Thermoplasmata archaeon]|nr:transposase [Thermoplasmata archaeon]